MSTEVDPTYFTVTCCGRPIGRGIAIYMYPDRTEEQHFYAISSQLAHPKHFASDPQDASGGVVTVSGDSVFSGFPPERVRVPLASDSAAGDDHRRIRYLCDTCGTDVPVRAEKLAPIVAKLVSNGLFTLDLRGLRGILKP